MLTAVESYHGVSEIESHLHLFWSLKMVTIGPESFLVPIAEYGERCGIEHILVGSLGKMQLANGLLSENRVGIILTEYPNVSRCCYAQPITDSNSSLLM